jgi:hypothetical protein
MPGQYAGGYPTGSTRGGCEVADSIEDKIEHNESKTPYENYLIWLRSYELKSGGWVPRAVVVIPSEEGNGEQDLHDPGASTVSTREDADSQAFTIAKQWIDERLAGCRQDRALPRSA